MNSIVQYIAESNIVNFIIVLFIIVFLMLKLNLKEKIEYIRKEITSYVENSEQEKINAEKNLQRINEKVIKLPQVIERINKIADNNIKNIGLKISSEIEQQKQDINNNAKRIFNLETKKFQSKLINILSEKSVDMAKENALQQLNTNKELHNKYIEDAINELDKVNL